jgi:pyrroloquinoline quinone biosynthesis protein E
MEILFVTPDYYAAFPKACMDGWGRRFIVVAPDGLVLPCHAAHTLPGLAFDNARDRPLAEIWQSSPAFGAFRGEEWMPQPCRSCDRRTLDFGGCRCQAFHLTGDAAATDPVCPLAPDHGLITDARRTALAPPPGPLEYRAAHPVRR